MTVPHAYGWPHSLSARTDAFFQKKSHPSALVGIATCAPAAEGGHDYDDILGFPGDGFQDKDAVEPAEASEPAVEGGDAEMNEAAPPSGPSSALKRKASAAVPPDDFVDDRIKTLKKTIGGCKRADNEWTEMLRGKVHQDTVKDNFAGDRTLKNNRQWVATTPTATRDGPPKWSWFGVLFMLAPFGLLSEKQEYPTVWVCACTKG